MEYSKILDDKIKVTSRIATGAYTDITANFTMRFVFGGNEMCTIGRRQLSIHNDSFIILNKGTRFTSNVETNAGVQIFTIEFDDSFLNSFSRVWMPEGNINDNEADNRSALKKELIETIYPFRGEIKTVVSRMKEYLDSGYWDDTLLKEYLNRCLLCYFQIYNEEIYQKTARLNFLHYNTRIEILKRLNLAKEYLYANYNGNVNLEGLADHACLSVNHLLRTFKLAYNQSPHQFLIQLRLQRAQLLLTKTEYPVYEIVNMVGFKCTSSFIRLFRNRYKTTPLKYRNVIA